MVKNEIHARLPPELMEQLNGFVLSRNLPTLSHGVRWLIDIALKDVRDELELEKRNISVIQLIEQEYRVLFSRCRDEYDTEDGQLYWFWFDSEVESSWVFCADSPNNWCPKKRFKTQDDAIRDCLREKSSKQLDEATVDTAKVSLSFSSTETEIENIIDW
ncbi:hypothetical protein [Microcoleus sp. D2_18a_B4]|uniref:hypothetical protein n=1 Tax=Microcoleus sp. D2_18a_B4 TaxID=3055329 RepID=UPI002FCFF7FE